MSSTLSDENPVVRDIYRDMYDETAPPSRGRGAEAEVQLPGGTKLASPANRRCAAKTFSGDRLAREDRLRISEILYSSGCKDRGSGGNRDSTWLVFLGKGQTSLAESTKWKGSLPKVDLLHEYTVLYRFEKDVYDPLQRVACIKKVLETRRAPLDREILKTILGEILKMDAQETSQILAAVFGEVTKISKIPGQTDKISLGDDPAINLGAFLRRFGKSKWLQRAEERIQYFQDWYAEALVPPYEPDSIKYLPPETISAMARIAISEPWKLCFWWMTGAPLLEELDRTQAESIAQKYGGEFPESARMAVAAYHGRPFADARGRGDSYVPFAWFKDPKNFARKQKFGGDGARGEDDRLARDPRVLQACLKHGVVRIVKEEISDAENCVVKRPALSADEEAAAEAEADLAKIVGGGSGENLPPANLQNSSQKPRQELRVYCVGDMRCEAEVAELIMRAVREPEDGVVKMRPRSSWWPQRELRNEIRHRDSAVDMDQIPTPTPTPNEEQAAAIEAAMHTRLGVVCGKPGTGKTAMVMKVLFSAFVRGQCVGVSFTGMAAHNQHKVAGYGVTAHKVVNEWRRAGSDVTGQREHLFSGRRILVIEESSAISMRLLHATLVALGPSLRRIYFFGDYRQMPPPDGGPSILEALVRRYSNTKIISELRTSMRVADATGAFVRNLDRICEHRICEEEGYEENFTRKLEWSADPASKVWNFFTLTKFAKICQKSIPLYF